MRHFSPVPSEISPQSFSHLHPHGLWELPSFPVDHRSDGQPAVPCLNADCIPSPIHSAIVHSSLDDSNLLHPPFLSSTVYDCGNPASDSHLRPITEYGYHAVWDSFYPATSPDGIHLSGCFHLCPGQMPTPLLPYCPRCDRPEMVAWSQVNAHEDCRHPYRGYSSLHTFLLPQSCAE